jgi:hypothetical protein
MGPEILRPDSEDAVASPAREVEFALMLSRVIDSVRKNPEYLRATIYELARHKLREQYKSESFADVRKLSKALEIAIQGVEAFNKKKEEREAALTEPDASRANSLISGEVSRHDVTPASGSTVIEVRLPAPESRPTRERLPWFKSIWLLVAVQAVGIVVVLAAVSLELLGNNRNVVISPQASILPKVETPVSPQSTSTADIKPAAASPPLPSSFGIYAVSNQKLYELDLLPGRAPDARIAISALITAQGHTTLPDGHLTFIVYRRDSATNAADQAEVRLVARIERETSYDKDGRPVVTSVDDNWAMRNISIPYRTGPKEGTSDMYEIRSENPDVPLASGRYALVLKGLAYDFSVAGTITDPRQCLERLVASNGQFYSECKKQQPKN